MWRLRFRVQGVHCTLDPFLSERQRVRHEGQSKPRRPTYLMLFLTFRWSRLSRTVGPIDALECRGPTMRLSDVTDPIAQYARGCWIHNGISCSHVEARSMLWLQFADESGALGPLVGPKSVVAFRGPYVFAGRVRMAKLDASCEAWLQTNTSQRWSLMRITPTLPTSRQS